MIAVAISVPLVGYSTRVDLLYGTEEQQSVFVLHRTRRQLVKFWTAQINSLHGTLLEFGETIHKGRAAMEREFP